MLCVHTTPAGVEAALGAMMRGHQAVLLCPLAQLRGGSLVPDPPDAEGGSGSGARGASAEAAPAYGEVELELLDFSQVQGGGLETGFESRDAESCAAVGPPAPLPSSTGGGARARGSGAAAGSALQSPSRPPTHPLSPARTTLPHPPARTGARHGGRRRRGEAHRAQGPRRVPHRLPPGGQPRGGAPQARCCSPQRRCRWWCCWCRRQGCRGWPPVLHIVLRTACSAASCGRA